MDWERNRFRVVSPKTAHHADGGIRWVPLFPELRPFLEEAFDQAQEGAVYVISSYRDDGKNFRTRMNRIIERAGLKPWVKTFHNLRASRETELAAEHPLHVVVKWIGNSTTIAQKHYLQVTDQDFERAAQRADAKSDAANPKTTRNPTQYRAGTEMELNEKTQEIRWKCEIPWFFCDLRLLPEGFEPPTYGFEDHCSIQLSYGSGRS